MLLCTAQKLMILISYFLNVIKVFKRVDKLKLKRTGAQEKHVVLNFFINCDFHVICAAQKRMILLNNIIFVK